MQNWRPIDIAEYEHLWNFIFEDLQFHPYKTKQNIIQFPMPNECYDISKFYNKGFSEDIYNNLHECSLKCFKELSKNERIYALNWQHECYSFSPYLSFEIDEFGEWLIPVFPNGDYIFFIFKDLSNGIFADGINLSFCLFGNKLIKCFQKQNPLIFTS